MKKEDILILQNGINQVGHLQGVKFAYAVARNDALIKGEVDAINKSVEPSKELMEYDQKRLELVREYSKKDSQGNPVVENNNFVVEPSLKEEFDKKIKSLRKEFKEVLEARDKQVENYQALLKEESDTRLYTMSINDVPKDITPSQLAAILPMINED